MEVEEAALPERGPEITYSPPEAAPLPPVEPPAEPIYQLESAPLALAAPTSLAAKLKFDGFRCGLAPLAAFSRSFQSFKPRLPLPAPSTPRLSPTVDVVMTEVSPSPRISPSPVERMELDQPSLIATTTQASTSTSPGFLRKISHITKQFVNLQIQPSSAPADISPLVGMMAQLSLNDKQQTRKAQLPRPTSAWSRRIQQSVKPQPTSLSAPSPQSASSSSGQSSSVPATAATVKTEKKQIASAPAPSPSSATSETLPKSATPATPQRPAGQLPLPGLPARRRPLPLFASARKALSQGTGSKSAPSSSSGQPSSAKATAIPPTAEKKKPTPTASNSKPLPQSAASKQPATSSSSGQSSASAQASAAKTETKKLSTLGAIDPKLANILDQLEAEENEAKTEKPKPKTKPAPKPEPESISEEELSFDELEKQLAVEELAMENERKSVPQYKGKDRKIAPLKRK